MERSYVDIILESKQDRGEFDEHKQFQRRKREIQDQSNGRIEEIFLTGLKKIKYKIEGESSYWRAELYE